MYYVCVGNSRGTEDNIQCLTMEEAKAVVKVAIKNGARYGYVADGLADRQNAEEVKEAYKEEVRRQKRRAERMARIGQALREEYSRYMELEDEEDEEEDWDDWD